MPPRAFVGSSVEGLDIAYALQQGLERDIEVTVWDQGVFALSSYVLLDLVNALDLFDFAVLVFSPDDVVRVRDRVASAVRDNVVFELGLFIGRLGRERTFVVMPKGGSDLHLPSELLGLSLATFEPNRSDGNLRAALGPACNQIRKQILRIGPVRGPAPPAPPQIGPGPTVLVVDDDLTLSDPLFREFDRLFAGWAGLALVNDPDEACDLMTRQPNLVGCITDLVFRRHSELGGVRVADAALRRRIPVVVITGHAREHLGLALVELRRVGLPEERVLARPVAAEAVTPFLTQIREWIHGPGA